MASLTEFDELVVLDAKIHCSGSRTGMRQFPFVDRGPKHGHHRRGRLHAFGDKFRCIVVRLTKSIVSDAWREDLSPLAALKAFFPEIVERSVATRNAKAVWW